MKLKLFPLIILLTLLIIQNVYADISWEQIDTVNDSDGISKITQNIYFSGNKFAIENDAGVRMILDLGQMTLTTVDANEKMFFTITLEGLEQMREKIKAETDRIIEETTKELPEDQRLLYREMIEKKMKDNERINANIQTQATDMKDYKPTGDSLTILGYTTIMYRAEKGDDTWHEMWCTEEIDISDLKNFFATIRQNELFKGLGKEMNKLERGFPLKSREIKEGKVFASEVVKISFQPIRPEVFTVPDNHTENSF